MTTYDRPQDPQDEPQSTAHISATSRPLTRGIVEHVRSGATKATGSTNTDTQQATENADERLLHTILDNPTTQESRTLDITAEREKTRITLDLSPELYKALDDLAVQMSTTKSDVLRKGIVLVGLALRAKHDGLKFGLADPSQPLVTEVVGL